MKLLSKLEKIDLLKELGCKVPQYGTIDQIFLNTNSNYIAPMMGEFCIVYREYKEETKKQILDYYNFEDLLNLRKVNPNLIGCKFVRSYDDEEQVFIRYKLYCIGFEYYWILQTSKNYDFKEILSEKLIEPCIFDLKKTYLIFNTKTLYRNKIQDIPTFTIDFVVVNYQLINETKIINGEMKIGIPIFNAVDFDSNPILQGTTIEKLISSKKIKENIMEYNQSFIS